MEEIQSLLQGFAIALTWKNVALMFTGIILGVIIGVLPGLGGANGVAILLYNRQRRTVVLTRQFRFPAYVNEHDGMLIEVCAGLLDKDNPEEAIKRETEEETGFQVQTVTKVFEAFMSPGSVTERLYFFVAEYSADSKVANSGGIEAEGEDIEVLELAHHRRVGGKIDPCRILAGRRAVQDDSRRTGQELLEDVVGLLAQLAPIAEEQDALGPARARQHIAERYGDARLAGAGGQHDQTFAVAIGEALAYSADRFQLIHAARDVWFGRDGI